MTAAFRRLVLFVITIAVATVIGCDAGETASKLPTSSVVSQTDTRTYEHRAGPNVVLITLDTVRADGLGAYGQTRPSSPELDRLAREGILFEQVASAAPSTLPSHASIMTGLFPFAHGARSNSGHVLSNEIETLAEVLRAHGYRTGAEIAAPVINASTQLDQGFEHYQDLRSPRVEKVSGTSKAPDGTTRRVEVDERDATDITRWGQRFIADHASESFFLWLHYFDPHQRYTARAVYDAMIPDSRYHAEIRHVDTEIGKIIREIETRGLRERTLVVIVADHGEGLGEHGESTHAYFVYDTTIRVPLIFWGPADVWRSDPVEGLARTVDIAPTILDYIGLPALKGIHGTSLLPRMKGEATDSSPPAYGESIELVRFGGGSPIRYLRRGDWKYVHKFQPELYNLADDPKELANLAGTHPEKLAELRGELEQMIAGAANAPKDAHSTVSPEEQAQLRALGYLATTETRSDLDDTLASTELHGPDPNEIVGDIDLYAKAVGFAENAKHDTALAILEPLADRYPESPEILSVQAESLLALDRNQQARDILVRVLAMTPCSLRVHEQLGQALRGLEAEAEAFELLRRGAYECPDEYVLLNNFAYSLATDADPARRNGAEAIRLSERALRLSGGDKPEILDTVAAAQAETGNYLAATVALRRAISLARRQEAPTALRTHLESQLESYEKARVDASVAPETSRP
jgi:arylsulfatase A-like enzyme